MEAMIASVILAVAAMGIVSLLLSAEQNQTALQENSTAVLLAKQLMEEIAARPFASPPQYNGYADNTLAMTTQGGQSVTPGDGQFYSRTVSIQPVTIAGSNAPSGDLQLVQVTVTTPSQQKVTLNRLLTNVTWP